MKTIQSYFASAMLAAISVGFVSCDSDDNDGPSYLIIDFNKESIKMDSETKAWDDVYDPECNNDLVYGNFKFSHSGNGGEFPDFNGFCPSISTAKEDKGSTQGYLDYQWASIAGSGVIPNSPYMVAHWAAYLESDENHSCMMTCDRVFEPVGVYISNSAYSYYVMKKGNTFAHAFGADDYFTLRIHGERNGLPTGYVDVKLAEGTSISDKWIPVGLTSLGTVDTIYFTMDSSDFGKWGINTPTYFCLDGFTFSFPEQ